jgi:hypothetical protein
MESSKSSKQKQYFRLTITYSDGETSGRVFSNREKAEKYAARQKRSPVVKKTKVEAFTKDRYDWHKSQMNRQDKTRTSTVRSGTNANRKMP